ncbi:MAG: VWA domain-containing protein, partial [Rhodothermales bacterium]|nr:VWA domain-containing protein [Rhodothermales bacterium]
LGEWKVLASPQSSPFSDSFNIASPDLGGHVIWSNPYTNGIENLIASDDMRRVRLDAAEATQWVIGFHHQRAALITELHLDRQPSSAGNVMTRFNVSVSTDSPTGPWTSVGQWIVDGDDGGHHGWKLDNPVWARYVRFSNSEVQELGQWYLPKTIKIFEAAPSATYRSILGEWGHYGKAGPFEYNSAKTSIADRTIVDAGDSRSSAKKIKLEVEYADNVSVGKDEDWFEIQIPRGNNRLRLDLNGDPTFRGDVRAQDSDSNEIELVESKDSTPQHRIFEAEVEPGKYYVHVQEPPRSVAFLWDNSGSVASYLATIYQTMSEFGSGVSKSTEYANWLPFGSKKFLLEEWSDEPYVLQEALSNYQRDHSSSNSEEALLIAMREMEGRKGTKAIVMLTDALTFSSHKNTELWQRFDRDRPRVFTLELHSGSPSAQDLMQSWASVDAGYYDYFDTNASLEVGFRRASCHIRRPANYAIEVTARNEAPPADGHLFVAMEDASFDAIEIILDASGSMLQRIEGKRRIAIARDVLTDLVDNTIPDGTPLALRIFGHRTPGECQTDLEVPLGPINKDAVKTRILQTEAKNLAKTPIGASLAQVASDLKTAQGEKLILLITDGEETCDGDPAAAIDALKEQGLDIRVNIVGFAIDDQQLKNEFTRWANAGGGRYFDAANETDLASSIIQALLPKYQVLDDTDSIVAEGTVGSDSLSLAPGTYTVKVLTSPAQILPSVGIVSDNTTTLNVQPDR